MRVVQIYSEEGYKPEKQTQLSVGYDLHSIEDVVIEPHSWKLVHTGVYIALPDDVEAQVRTRSGWAYKKGVFVLNSPGTIDPDYRGEVGVILANFSDEPVEIKKGDRIAQLVFNKIERIQWWQVDNKEELGATTRGIGGFGSTGV